MNETPAGTAFPGSASSGVCIVAPAAGNAPIRFPHIPARDNPPPGTSSWLRTGGTLVRLDANHPPAGGRAKEGGAIPGVRSVAAGSTDGASDAAPVPSTGWPDGMEQGERAELLAINEQLRMRLVDFGNLLSASGGGNRTLEAGFETVCCCFSQLSARIRRAL